MKTKVTNVKLQIVHVVKLPCVEGILKLVWGDSRKKEFYKYGLISHDKTQFAKPIIISETEKIIKGDFYYDVFKRTIDRATQSGIGTFKTRRKILALSKQFRDRHIEDIKLGRLKEGRVLIQADEIKRMKGVSRYRHDVILKNNKPIKTIRSNENFDLHQQSHYILLTKNKINLHQIFK